MKVTFFFQREFIFRLYDINVNYARGYLMREIEILRNVAETHDRKIRPCFWKRFVKWPIVRIARTTIYRIK